jgi:hypothetical protein
MKVEKVAMEEQSNVWKVHATIKTHKISKRKESSPWMEGEWNNKSCQNFIGRRNNQDEHNKKNDKSSKQRRNNALNKEKAKLKVSTSLPKNFEIIVKVMMHFVFHNVPCKKQIKNG